MNQYISNEICGIIKKIANKHPEVVFCGSLTLVLNGLLKRKIHDIDILVNDDYHQKGGFFNEHRVALNANVNFPTSHTFFVDNNKIKCFPLIFNDIKVDVLYNENSSPVYEEFDFDETKILIEKPEAAINFKKKYILNDNDKLSVLKHFKDLILLGVEREELVNILNKSIFFKEKEHYFNDINVVSSVNDDIPF